jgi:hypothetical protein
MNDNLKAASIGALAGGGAVALLWYLSRPKTDPAWDYSKPKHNMLELIGHTPMVRLDSLSRATGNEIFVLSYD